MKHGAILLGVLLPQFVWASPAFKSFEACISSKGAPALTKYQQHEYSNCHKTNHKNAKGFKECLAQNGVPALTSERISAEKACRHEMYGK